MYCRMCGKKIGDTDHFCQFCGTPTGLAEPSAEQSEIREEIIFNPPYEDKSKLEEEEDLKEFISEDEIEEAQQEEVQKQEEAEEPKPSKNSEFTWNVYEFPTEKKKTEDVEFNWNMDEFSQPELKSPEAAAFEEELFQEIRDDSNRIKEQNIDRFFTFSRKNEEFQELLDKEYEKVKMRPEPAGRTLQEQPVTENSEELPETETASAVEAPVMETAPAVETPVTEIAPMEPQVKVIKESGIPEAVPLQEIHIEPEAKTDEPEAKAEEPEAETAKPEAELKSEQIAEMELARAQYFAEDLIRDNESIRKKLSFGEPEQVMKPAPKPEKAVEDYMKKEKNYIEAPAEKEMSGEETAEEEPEEDADRRAESVAAVYAAAALEETEDQAAFPPSDDSTAAVGEEGEKEEGEKHRRSAGQIALIIIAIILIIEIAILGIRYFAPDSSAAKAIGNAQTEIFNTVSGWFDGKTDQNGSDKQALQEDSKKTDQDNVQKEESPADTQTKAPAADPNPMADKNALVSSQMGNNKNIEQIKANEALAWQQGENYGLSDINNSKPITNNIWQAPETGDPVYYDRSVVGTVIAFDSQWIDYVNSGDKSVLSLMKKDSEAYRKSINYSKVGKIKETFKLLELGEIRQGAKGFYIWVHEEIGATESGKASEMKYNWIYYLEPVDGQMKIVNYYHF